MHVKNYATALPAAAGLAAGLAALLRTACGGGGGGRIARGSSGNGSSFTVSWQRPEIQMPTQPAFVSGPIYH